MKHRTYIPIMNRSSTPGTRGQYLAMLSRVHCDTVFLAVEPEPFCRKDQWADCLKALEENVRFYSEAGFAVGVWTRGFGFGTPLPPDADADFGNMVQLHSLLGRTAGDAFCPTDPLYRKRYAEWITLLCRSGASLLMIDDDLCQSVRPGIGCFCPRHRQLLAQELGYADAQSFSPDFLQSVLFTGAPGKERRDYCRVMGDSMKAFCRLIRDTADSVNPDMRVGFCAGYTSFDSEGADAPELTRILAGRHRPFLRLSGAPYWVAAQRMPEITPADVTEFVRMQKSFCPPDWELFHEADTYPRPRTSTPADLCEGYDLALRTEAGLGGLNYLFDYTASPTYETGYYRAHLRNQPFREAIDRLWEDTVPVGIRVVERMNKLRWSDCPSPFIGEKPLMHRALTRAGGFLANLGFPTVYHGEADSAICFGENARSLIGKPLPDKLILDFPAAKILQESGTDTGWISEKKAEAPFCHTRGTEIAPVGNLPFVYRLLTKPSASVLSFFRTLDDEAFPAVYRYRSGTTDFLVLAYDGYAASLRNAFAASYFRQEEISEFLGYRYPVFSRKPFIYQLCGRKKDGKTVSLFLNFSADTVWDDAELRISHPLKFIGNKSIPRGKGIVSLRHPVPPYNGFLAVWEERV